MEKITVGTVEDALRVGKILIWTIYAALLLCLIEYVRWHFSNVDYRRVKTFIELLWTHVPIYIIYGLMFGAVISNYKLVAKILLIPILGLSFAMWIFSQGSSIPIYWGLQAVVLYVFGDRYKIITKEWPVVQRGLVLIFIPVGIFIILWVGHAFLPNGYA